MLDKYTDHVVAECLANFKSVNDGEEEEFVGSLIDAVLPWDCEGLAQIVAADPRVLSLSPPDSDEEFPEGTDASDFLRCCIYDRIYQDVKERLRGKLDVSML